eukprot:CAMPEP_0174255264 /NCGR_PEP_ID=MMETSP0439-20130205/4607_1 /TAXON_ID=0 /ORGANISM="Stereomyxa ramosa, Strain Chinc5" /LENGTH=540 /DNA_ID=CAMNT_0015337371 /DNA_START=314 /DNA_END=1936 /DNA_ORIENTATION=-
MVMHLCSIGILRKPMQEIFQQMTQKRLPHAKYSVSYPTTGVLGSTLKGSSDYFLSESFYHISHVFCPYPRYAVEFEELEAIGEGGFGTVYRARKVGDDKIYAIKKAHFVSTNQNLQKKIEHLMREVKALATLDHPNVCRYHTAWVEPFDYQNLNNVKKLPGLVDSSECSTEDESTCSKTTISIDVCPDVPSSLLKDKTLRNFSSGIEIKDSELPIIDDFCNFSLEEEWKSSNIDDGKSFSGSSSDTRSYEFGSVENSNNQLYPYNPFYKNEELKLWKEEECTEIQEPGIFTLYIQMQCYDDNTLHDYIHDKNRSIDREKIVFLFQQILLGLQHVHSSGLVHRDLKPSNIFLSKNGAVKIGDFGLAKFVLTESQEHIMQEKLGSNHTGGVGTMTYAAPEQKEQHGSYNEKADIYSLGIILFELFNKPFATQMERLLLFSRLGEGSMPSSFIIDYPEEASLILRMVETDPAKRPSVLEILSSPLFVSHDQVEIIKELEAELVKKDFLLKEEINEKNRYMELCAKQEETIKKLEERLALLSND